MQERIGDRIRIHRGCDFHLFFDNIRNCLENRAPYTINGKRYLMVEFADSSIPKTINDVFTSFLQKNITPVITHPERTSAEDDGRWGSGDAGSEETPEAGFPAPKSVITSMAGFEPALRSQPGGRTGIPAAFKYPAAVSRRTPVAPWMRRSVHPSRPKAITCCFFSSLKTLAISAEAISPHAVVNVPEWVSIWPVFR